MADILARIKLRQGTAAQWASANPILAAGEPGYATDTGALFVGDGVTAYSSLPKFAAPSLALLGITASAAELNKLDEMSATREELNKLAGATFTTEEINRISGVNAPIQEQLNNRVTSNADDTLTGGYTTTAANDGTKTSGTYTPSPAGGNMKRIVNSGAFTLAAPSETGDFTLIVQITNSATAGAVTLSGFNKTVGDNFTTTNGHDFFVFITKCNGFRSAFVQALQ